LKKTIAVEKLDRERIGSCATVERFTRRFSRVDNKRGRYLVREVAFTDEFQRVLV
jgi:hypothetical protein